MGKMTDVAYEIVDFVQSIPEVPERTKLFWEEALNPNPA
jgi:hypothetical protein